VYSIFTEFRITVPLVRSTTIYLNGSHSKTQIGKHLSDTYPVKNLLKQGDDLLLLFLTYVCTAFQSPSKLERIKTEWDTKDSILHRC
jgi:hypothetical protein